MNAAPKPAAAPRMTLASVRRGATQKPPRVLVYGVEKIGKSTFAAAAPNAVFVCPEDGLTGLDVPHFPDPRSWQDVLDAIEALRTGDHGHQHVVFDTLDWLEPLCWRAVCEGAGASSIEDVGGGWGKGYVAALSEWRLFVSRLERLRVERDMGVILLAHAFIKKFQNPEAADFDRYQMKLHEKSAGFLKEWCDAVLFAQYETYAHEDRNKRVRGIATGARLLYTNRTAAYDAGNRYNLPPQLPLEWAAFAEAIAANRPADPATIKARIDELLTDCTDTDLIKKVRDAVATDPENGAFLARCLNTLAARLSQKENAQ